MPKAYYYTKAAHPVAIKIAICTNSETNVIAVTFNDIVTVEMTAVEWSQLTQRINNYARKSVNNPHQSDVAVTMDTNEQYPWIKTHRSQMEIIAAEPPQPKR